MPVSQQTPYIAYLADGLTTIYAFPFRIMQADHLLVMVDGAKVLNYAVAGAGAAGGGSITFNPAPAAGGLVELKSSIPSTRPTNYLQDDNFRAETVEQDQDLQSLQIRDLAHELARTIKMPDASKNTEVPRGQTNVYLGLGANGEVVTLANAATVNIVQGVADGTVKVYADASAGQIIVNLAAAGSTDVIVIKTDVTENPVTLTPGEGETVCRAVTVDLTLQDESIRVEKNGTNWYRIG